MTPDIGVLRHKVIVPPDDDVLKNFLDTLSMMTGAEYLTLDILKGLRRCKG